jgi:DNA-binding NtrC family response regulator
MKKMKVLLVDDEGELVYTMAERLELRGYEADAVTSGVSALQLMKNKEYDVAVVDVKMPGMSGEALLGEVKEAYPDLPVIMLTGHASSDKENESIRRSASTYLYKPIDIEDLIRAMESCCKPERTAGER